MSTLDELTIPAPEPSEADWNAEGVVHLPGLIPDHLLDAYAAEWRRSNGDDWATCRQHGWDDCTPYMRHEALRAILLAPELSATLTDLVGEPMGVHLNLTGWRSTERDWHQDGYLNPAHVGDHYAAVWFALDRIDPLSGPFQYVPGSHRWPQVTQERMLAALEPHERVSGWPKASERILVPLFESEIVRRRAPICTYLPERGDVLIWHGRLLHRGSRATIPGLLRPALIAHYSGIRHRPDMPSAIEDGGGWLFPIAGRPPAH